MLRAARDLALDVIVRVMFGADDPAERTRLGRPFETLLDLGSSEQLIVRVALHSIGGLKRWPKLERANEGIDNLLSPYQVRLFNGARRAARAHGARLLGFQGNVLRIEGNEPAPFDGSFLYDLACGDGTDGLIVVPQLLSAAQSDYVNQLLDDRFPLICAGWRPGTGRS